MNLLTILQTRKNNEYTVEQAGEKNLNFWNHLEELRKTFLRMICAVILFTIGAFCFKEQLFDIILAPQNNRFWTYRLFESISQALHISGMGADDFQIHLINTQLSGQFLMHMNLSLYAGIILSSPYLIYQLFHFISPALYTKERTYSLRAILWGYTLFIMGVLFCYFIVFPFALRFLALYQVSPEVANTITIQSYTETLCTLSILSGITFEIPILAWVLAKTGLLTASFMKKYRRHAIIITLIIAAIITPTSDAITLLLTSLPMLVLYEISIRIVGRNEAKTPKHLN